MNRSEPVTLRPNEKQYLAEQARAAGMPISTYIRVCALEGTEKWGELLRTELDRATEVCKSAELGITLHTEICRELGSNPPEDARNALVSAAKLLQTAYERGRNAQGLIWRTGIPSGDGNVQVRVACKDEVYNAFSNAAAQRSIKIAPHIRQMCLLIARRKDPHYKDPITHHGQYLVRCMDAVEEHLRTAEHAGWHSLNHDQLLVYCADIRRAAYMLGGM